MKSSTRRCSLSSTHWSGLKVPSLPSPRGTSHAIRAGRSSTLNRVIGPAPDLPSSRRDHVVSTPQPSGVTNPKPVITTLRGAFIGAHAANVKAVFARSALGLLDEFYGVADRHDRLCGIVRNFDSEFFLERHDQFDGVEAVCAQIFNEAGIVRDLFAVDIQMFDHDLLHALS